MNKDNKRLLLKALSQQAEEIRTQKIEQATNEETASFWATRSINYILINSIYKTGDIKEFKSFEDWKADGGTVRRGAKAFVIWGQMVEGDNYNFFPLKYLFANTQVYFPADVREKENIIQEAQELEL